MKWVLLFLFGFPIFSAYAQNMPEASVLRLSEKVFEWEVARQWDSLNNVLDAHLIVVGSDGHTQSKQQYIQRLTGGTFVHNNILVEESKAIVADNTAVVAGKGRFAITNAGAKNTLHLSYMEVFARADNQSSWRLLAIKANILSE